MEEEKRISPMPPIRLSVSDVHGQSEDEASVRQALERLRQILNNAAETGIITLDLSGVVTGWSEGARNILGWSEDEMMGTSLARLFPDDEGEHPWRRELADALSKGIGMSEGWRLRKNGDRLWAIGETKPLFDGRHEPLGFVKTLRDRTENRKTETALREQTKAL